MVRNDGGRLWYFVWILEVVILYVIFKKKNEGLNEQLDHIAHTKKERNEQVRNKTKCTHLKQVSVRLHDLSKLITFVVPERGKESAQRS